MATIAIAGAGVLGRLLAWELARAGHAVQVVDPAAGPEPPPLGGAPQDCAAGFTAAGMLSPTAELDGADADIAALGWRSIERWCEIAAALGEPALVRRDDSLLLAHGSDLGAAQRMLARVQVAALAAPQALSRHELQCLEPALLPGLHAWRLPGEGQLLPREMLQALAAQASGVCWRWGRRVAQVQPHALQLDDGSMLAADLAIDVRGRGAAGTGSAGGELRGVRGELVWLHAPGVTLQRPLRLLHARHRVYLVPRPGDLVIVGASEIESEDRSPVSLRSAVELMAAAHSVLPALAEARIVHLDANLRPAWPDHRPRLEIEPGLMRITGLFRHGWLLAPALVEQALTRCPVTSEPCHA